MNWTNSIILVVVASGALISGCGGGGSGSGSTDVPFIDDLLARALHTAWTTEVRGDGAPLPGSLEGEYRYSMVDRDDEESLPQAAGAVFVVQDSDRPDWVQLVFQPDPGSTFPVPSLEGAAWDDVDLETTTPFTACELDGLNGETGTMVYARLIFHEDEIRGEIEITDADGVRSVSVLSAELAPVLGGAQAGPS